jgi:hypothetical protein
MIFFFLEGLARYFVWERENSINRESSRHSHASVLRESAYHTISMYIKLGMRPLFLHAPKGILKGQ